MSTKKIIAMTMSAAMALTMTGMTAFADDAAEPVTIKVFSNLPDRTSGQGLVEQTIFDAYMAEHPNVTIEMEELSDEPYKTKFKAYAASDQMPDLVSVWGQPGFIDEVIDAGLLEELNPDDFKDYGFIDGSLDGFSKDGKLYGLPRNTDVQGVYYNGKMFEENDWSVPTTFEEFQELCGKIKDAGIIPVAMDGADKWPLCTFMYDLMVKEEGTGANKKVYDAIQNADFSDPMFAYGADTMKSLADAGVFETGYETTDYGTAQNLFLNSQAAMYVMGSWDMSIAANEDVPEDVRNNFHAFSMPRSKDATGDSELGAWNGGGYAVTANAAQKDAALDLLKYIYLPENWTKIAWENGVCMSAQDFSQYATGNETPLQKDFMDMVANATALSGTPINDMGTAAFKTVCEDSTQEVTLGTMSTDDYLKALTDACAE